MRINVWIILRIGYDKAAKIAKKAYKKNKTIRQICLEEKILTTDELQKILDPYNMIAPNDRTQK